MNWELLIKVLASVVALVGGIYQLRHINPIRRVRLKADLEILEKIDRNSEHFQIVNAHIDKQLRDIYGKRNRKIKIYKQSDFIIGVIWALLFTFLSVYLYSDNDGFTFWHLITIFMLVASAGLIGSSMDPDENLNKTDMDNLESNDTDDIEKRVIRQTIPVKHPSGVGQAKNERLEQ